MQNSTHDFMQKFYADTIGHEYLSTIVDVHRAGSMARLLCATSCATGEGTKSFAVDFT